MRTLPANVRPTRRTGVFTADAIPKGLLSDHRTRAGVWGEVTAVTGTVRLRFAESGEHALATPGAPVVVAPEETHAAAPSDDASFFIQFYE